MNTRILVFKKSTGVLALDTEQSLEYATNISIETTWPQGYHVLSFTVKRRDPFLPWAIAESDTIQIRDWAGREIYNGRIETIPKTIGGGNQSVTVTCVGWFVRFRETMIAHGWVNDQPFQGRYSLMDFKPPASLNSDNIQLSFLMDSKRSDNYWMVRMGTKDINRKDNEGYEEEYIMPSTPVYTSRVRKVTYTVTYRTGERLRFKIRNNDTTVIEYGELYQPSIAPSAPQLETYTFSSPPTAIGFIVASGKQDDFDQNDWLRVTDCVIEAAYQTNHPQYASPTYTQGEILRDIVLIIGNYDSSLSTDITAIADPGQTLRPFVFHDYTEAADIVQEILSLGDSSQNSWGLAVWGSDATSDGNPQVEVKARDVSDYEYMVSLQDRNLVSISLEDAGGNLFNHIIVNYEAEDRRAVDATTFSDTTSINAEYLRSKGITLGTSDTAVVAAVGNRTLDYHKDRKTRGAVVLRQRIQLKSGAYVPVSWVRAGERFKLLDTGEIFFIQSTRLDADNMIVSISPDIEPDFLPTFLAQMRRARDRDLGAR